MDIQKRMNGAEYLCTLLKNHGVRTIFGLFGDIQTDFAKAVRTSSIRWVHVHNEKSGGFMADIYARVSGGVGVVFSTLGPGATNLTSALANATQDRVPLVGISDQVPVQEFSRETHQYINLAEAFHTRTGITKKTFVVRSLAELPAIIDEAFVIVQTEPKGAVHISFPADLYARNVLPVKKQKIAAAIPATYPKSTLSYARLLAALYGKHRALVIAGGLIEREGSQKEFRAFVEQFDVPVLTTFRGKNVLPSDHPNNLGTVSRHLGDVLARLVRDASCILTVGYDYNEGLKPSVWGNATVINVNSFDNRVPGVFTAPSYFGNVRDVFARLAKEKKPSYAGSFAFLAAKKDIQTIVAQALAVSSKKLHPRRIIDAINDVFTDNTVIVCDIGLNKYYSGLLLKSFPTNQILFSNGQSAMAFTSGALGAKIANPKKYVVVLVGDGGFLMNPQEVLSTVVHRQPMIWIIFNNGGLGLVEQAQYKNSKKTHGVYFGNVLFPKLAAAFGVDGVHLGPGKNLKNILLRYKKAGRSVIIDVPVEYAVRK